jgi:hypothetical protein
MADTIKLAADDDPRAQRPPRGERPPSSKRPPRATATSSRGDDDTGGTAGAPSRRRRRTSRDDALIVEGLTGLYGMVGAGVAGVGQVQGNAGFVAAGVNITLQGETLAQQWLAAADQSPAIRRALEGMVKGGAVSAVVMGNIGIILPILAASGVVPQQVGNMFLAPEAIAAAQAFQAAQAQAQTQNGATPGA